MSMTGEYRRLTAKQLEDLLDQVRNDPEVSASFLYFDTRQFEGEGAKLSVGKGWQGLYFILNGDPDEITTVEGNAVYGGQEAGADVSYGPVRYMTSTQVRDVSRALETVAEDDFKARFDPEAFRAADIYSGGDWSHPNDLPWLWEMFSRLRDFFRSGAVLGDAMLLYLA